MLGVATFITDPDAMGIPVLYVAPYLADRAAVMYGAVATDVNVIARPGAEAPCAVVALQPFEGVILRRASVGAMED